MIDENIKENPQLSDTALIASQFSELILKELYSYQLKEFAFWNWDWKI